MLENAPIPNFHIHQEVEKNGKKMVFRYWRLRVGNMTSERNVLSNLLFDAVYDIVNDPVPMPQMVELASDVIVLGNTSQEHGDDTPRCPYISESPNRDGWSYCTFNGHSPKSGWPWDENQCPFIALLKGNKGNDDSSDKKNDIGPTRLIEIGDVTTLVKALFKINMDIADREYVLITRIPENS